jgi:YHS domain-containing protein
MPIEGGTMNSPKQLDPVCGMTIDADGAPARASHEGVRYHFCSSTCRDRFVRDPLRYLGEGAESPSGWLSSVESSAGDPRACPECGTTVEPSGETPFLGALTMTEYATMVRHLWRHRLGRRAYGREHSARLVRALALHAVKPESPVAAIAVEEELTREVARLRAEGLNRAQVQRELYHLFRAASEVLVRAGLPARETAAMIELLDRRLVSLLEWKTGDQADAWELSA